MKKKLLRTFLLAACLLVGTNAWAATETYNFSAWYQANTGADTYFTLGATSYSFSANSTCSTASGDYVAGTAYDHDVTTYLIASYGGTIPTGQALNSRIALSRVCTSKNNYGFRIRNSYNGLYNQTRGKDTFAYNYLSLVGLKAGETVTITFTGAIRSQSTNFAPAVAKNTTITSGTTYTMSADGDLHLELTGGAVISNITIITLASETCTMPSITATAANGINRTVTIVDGVGSEGTGVEGTYYATSTDNGETYSDFQKYTEALTISSTTKFKAYTKLTNDVVSETNEVSIAAGTTLTLTTPTISFTGKLAQNGTYYYPVVSVSSNNTSLPGNPAVSYTATLNGNAISVTNGDVTLTESGTLEVYSSSAGFSNSSTSSFTGKAYERNWSLDLDNTEVTTAMGYTTPAGNGTYFGQEMDYYTLQSNITDVLGGDFAGYNLYGGYGIYVGSETGAGNRDLKLKDGTVTADQIAHFVLGRFDSSNRWSASNTTHWTFATTNIRQTNSRMFLNLIELYSPLPENVSAPITSSTGYATFSSTYALDFTGITTLTAYKATACNGTSVTLEPITGTVAPNTGLVIQGETTNIPVVATGDAQAENLLVACSSETPITPSATGTNYVLSVQSDVVVFAPVTGDNATVAADHAFLYVPTATPSRTLNIVFGDEATAISAVQNNKEQNNEVCNLAGQRVAQPAKGLYIVNGKKVIMK